ncbi:MAG: DUF3187 family protein [Candidatus Binatia bacterium]|nr:DUF3187 family protein [Candidatus Binatia bacterium]
MELSRTGCIARVNLGASTRKISVAVACILAFACARSDAVEPSGPLGLRNFQPLRQIFLHPPFVAARVLEPGRLRFSVETAESNVIATDRGAVDALLKFEQNRTALRLSLGLAPAWQASVELPLLSRFGGVLDPVIDSTEDLFSAFNPERRLFPNNTFGGFWVRRRGQVLFHGPRQYAELGDVSGEVQREVWSGASGGRLAARFAIEAPTGRSSAVWGSGIWEVASGVAGDYPLWSDRLWVYGNLNGVFPLGRVSAARLALDPFLQQTVAFERMASKRWSFLLQQELYTSPFRELHSAVLEGTIIELAVGVVYRDGPWRCWLGGIDNVSGVAQAADFTAIVGCDLTMRPRWNRRVDEPL